MKRPKLNAVLAAKLKEHVKQIRQNRADGVKPDHGAREDRARDHKYAEMLGTDVKNPLGPVYASFSLAQIEREEQNLKREKKKKLQQKRSIRAEALRMHQDLTSGRMSSTMAVEFVAARFGVDPRTVWLWLKQSPRAALKISRKK